MNTSFIKKMIIFDLIFVLLFLFAAIFLFIIILLVIIQTRNYGELIAFLVLFVSTLVISIHTLLNSFNNAISLVIDNESLEFQLFSGKKVHFLKNELTKIRRSERQVIIFGENRRVIIQKRFLSRVDKLFVYTFFDKSNFPETEFQYPIF